MDHHTIFERLKKAVFRVRNGSVTPREEGFAKQTDVMLFGKWSAYAVTRALLVKKGALVALGTGFATHVSAHPSKILIIN
jgi:hypothetical protein